MIINYDLIKEYLSCMDKQEEIIKSQSNLIKDQRRVIKQEYRNNLVLLCSVWAMLMLVVLDNVWK